MGQGYGGGYGGGKMGPAAGYGGPGGYGTAGYGASAGGGYGGAAGSRPMPYNMRIPKQPGDWDCPKCGNMNFARRASCNGEGGTCNMEKQPEFIRRGTEGGPKNRRPGICLKYLFNLFISPGDWDCGRCGNMNYARRDECNKCQASKSEAKPSYPSGGESGWGAGGWGGYGGWGGMGGGYSQPPVPRSGSQENGARSGLETRWDHLVT